MAVMWTSVVALLVQASVWPKVGAAKDTYQQPPPALAVFLAATLLYGPFTVWAASMARPPSVKAGREALTTCHHLAFANADPNASHVVLSLHSYGGSARRQANWP